MDRRRSSLQLFLLGGLLLGAFVLTRAASAQALPAACPNGGPDYAPFGVSEFQPVDIGTPMLRHTLSGPNSTCNDGSPAVMYLRPATAYYSGPQLPPNAQEPERWVIFFDGGGGCGTEDECLQRWCGISGFNTAGKMSSLGAYDAIPGATGIFNRNPAVNAFAGYNQVLLSYCSSDNWIGSESHASLAPSSGPTYDIEFQGEAIVLDAFDTLVAGAAPDSAIAQQYWNDVMPTLLSAEEIVLVGESAGGGGLRHHVDRIRDWLLGQMAPETRIVAVVDAGAPVGLFGSAIDWSDPSSPASYTDYLMSQVEPRVRDFWGAEDSALDASCLDPAWTAAHNAVGSHPQICLDTTYTLFEHITTPLFLRQDINDTLARERYADWALVPNLPTFWALQFSQNAALPGWAALEPPLQPHGVFGPRCNQHVSVLTNDFYTHTVTPAAGALSFHDLVVNWMAGAAPTTQIQVDAIAGPMYSASFCP